MKIVKSVFSIVVIAVALIASCKKEKGLTLKVNITNKASVVAEHLQLYVKDYHSSDTINFYTDSLLLSYLEIGKSRCEEWELGELYDAECYLSCKVDSLNLLKNIALIDGGRFWSFYSERDVFI